MHLLYASLSADPTIALHFDFLKYLAIPYMLPLMEVEVDVNRGGRKGSSDAIQFSRLIERGRMNITCGRAYIAMLLTLGQADRSLTLPEL
jgi:hypothetical protein